MKVKRESAIAQPYPTPSDPMDCSSPDSSIHGIFQARVLEWGAIAFSKMLTYKASYISSEYIIQVSSPLSKCPKSPSLSVI